MGTRNNLTNADEGRNGGFSGGQGWKAAKGNSGYGQAQHLGGNGAERKGDEVEPGVKARLVLPAKR